MEIIKISILGLCAVLLSFFLKETKPEYGVFVTMTAGLCILALAVGKMQYLFDSLNQIRSYLPMDAAFLSTLIKMVGISYIGQFASGICTDAGYSSVGTQIELFARLAILVLSMPVLLALLETIQGIIG
ncbi:MAG: SpoIIIAC/SpoIIIAD family protein [Eubacteriales bacterium]|nr:SpoIIIAC/SpoIIIAD family protein [Eubacteriales bacterium]